MTTAETLTAPAATYAAGALPVGSYARRSKRAKGDGQGATINIADQHAQNRAYAAVVFPGRPVVEYDDNMSAWNPDVRRDDWERLLSDVGAGQLAAVVGRYPDRLTRQPGQGEALLAACRAGGAELHTTSAGHVASALAVRILWAVAAEESDQKSRRMTDAHRRIADAGGFHGGPRRFGFEQGMTALRADEAAAIRDAADRLLAGESLRSITADWNARGILTVSGKAWRSQNLGLMVRGEHLVKRRDGKAATWDAPAVLDAATHEAVTRFLANPDRRTSPTHTGRRRYLLSGLIACGVCDAPLYGRPTELKSGPAYVCRNGQHTQAPIRYVDEAVTLAVVARLSLSDASGVFLAPVDIDRANARAAERLALAENRRATVTDVRLAPGDKADALAAIDKRLDVLDAEAAADDDAAMAPLRVLDGLTGHPADATAGLVGALTPDRYRAVVAALAAPALDRASRKGARYVFEPERIRMRWIRAE